MKSLKEKQFPAFILGVLLLFLFLSLQLYYTTQQPHLPSPIAKTINHIITAKAAGVDVTKYTQSPYNLPAPNGEPDSDFNYNEKVAANLNTLGSAVASNQSYLTSKFDAKYVDPFLSVIWIGAIENSGADPYFWNCEDSGSSINAGCPGGWYSGGWQVGYGMQVIQAIDHLEEDFNHAYGGADDASKVQQVGQQVINNSGGKITNPSTFPTKSIATLVSEAKSGNQDSRQAIAVLLLDPKIGAITIALEVAGDIAGRDDWRTTMENWPGSGASYYAPNMQNFSNRMKKIADNYTGQAGSSGGGVGGGSYTLDLVLKPTEKDTYVLNKATAQAIGGGGGSGTGQGAPPGSVDGQCTPTGTYPSDPGGELQSKYKISTEGFGADGIKMIYELATCVSTSKFPTLLGGTSTTVHNAISPSLGSIGMDCDSTCNVWIPEGTNAFKFILTHEFGHVLYYTNPRETMHVSEFEDSWNKEGGLSPYSGPYYGGQGGCPTKGAVEDYAEMIAYYLNPTMGGKTGACDSRDNPKNSLFEDTHFPLHLEVAKQVL